MSRLFTRTKYEHNDDGMAVAVDNPSAGLALIPQAQELSKKQLAKLRNSEDLRDKENFRDAGITAGFSSLTGFLGTGIFTEGLSQTNLGIGALFVVSGVVFCSASLMSALMSVVCGAEAVSQLRIRCAGVDGIHTYYMSQAQYDDLRARFSDDEWDRVLTELAERPYEPLGNQLNSLLVEYVDRSATYRREIANMDAKCAKVPHAKQRLSNEYEALESGLDRVERDTAGQIKSAFDAHDDSMIEAIRISANSVLGPAEFTN